MFNIISFLSLLASFEHCCLCEPILLCLFNDTDSSLQENGRLLLAEMLNHSTVSASERGLDVLPFLDGYLPLFQVRPTALDIFEIWQ